jgi:uncharacterized protein (DUF1697 family)
VTSYVAFLRGVNLGPTKKVSMPELRALASELGYADVASHLNSGNLIFSTAKKAATVERELSAAIAETFGHPVDVTVRTADELQRVLADNPYPDGDPSQVTVAFLTGPVKAQAQERVAARAVPGERFTFGEREIYVDYANGIGNSKLAATFSAVVGVSATVRNVRTVVKLVELMSKRD